MISPDQLNDISPKAYGRTCGIIYLIMILKALSIERQSQMITYALLYPPRVRALLGAVLEEIQSGLDLNPLKESLNPFTKFALGFNKSLLKTAPNWNIQ